MRPGKEHERQTEMNRKSQTKKETGNICDLMMETGRKERGKEGNSERKKWDLTKKKRKIGQLK